MTPNRTVAASLFLVVLAAAPVALAQGTKPKKGGTKAAPSASAAPADTPAPTPEPAPAPSAADTKADDSTEAKKELPSTPPENSWDVTDTTEKPTQRYYFFGLRYRGDVIPQFLINAAVDGGATVFSNLVGVELDSRKDGFSTVWNLSLQNYNTGDLLFHEKGKPQTDNNFSVVNSSLNGIYASVDLLWSVPIEKHWDFEYGLGAGLGVIFGDLVNNWVYATANGPYYDAASNQHFTRCQAVTDNASCQTAAHTNATVAKVGNYKEETGILGPKPILFPMLNIPQIGLRYKPVKNFEARVGLGFSITGFWFGISGDYGLEKQEDSAAPATTKAPAKEGARLGPSMRGSPGGAGWL